MVSRTRTGIFSSIGLRSYWIWRERKKISPVGFGWAILPMVVVLVVLSIYGLSYFAMGKSWLRRAFSAVSYPESAWAEKILPGVNVSVGERKVVVDGVPVADVSDAWECEDSFADDIAEKLGETERFSRRITLSADKKIPFKIIRSIMHAAEETGYTEIQLVVIPKEPRT
jgi:biopolymer transport protein ExbD